MGKSTGKERRQRRGERRREEILAAAARVFAAKGYHNATTREVAEAADLAEGTIFNYFPSKRDLLLAVFEQGAEGLLDTVPQIGLDLPAAEALKARLEALLAFYAENRLYLQGVLAEVWTDPELLRTHALPRLQRAAAAMKEFLQSRIAAGQLRAVDTDLATRLMLGMMAAVALPIVRGVQPAPGPEERRRLAADIADLFFNGVGLHTEG